MPQADEVRAAGPRRTAFDWTDTEARRRAEAGLVRTLRPRAAESELLDLASNDYLGLTRRPEVTEAAAEAARRWGAGSTGSRLVTGTTRLHTRLERELADFCGFEAALVFSSGYTANLAALTALGGRDALVVSDASNHASIVDGCRLARAETAVVPHTDPEAVRKTLDAHPGRRALVVSDSVFSVDGDKAPLPELAAACRAHGAGLVVDDAHGLGVLGEGGRGALHEAGLMRRRGRRRHPDPLEVPRQPGRCRPRPGPGRRAPGERGPHLHLRHRTRPRGGRRRAREPASDGRGTGSRRAGPYRRHHPAPAAHGRGSHGGSARRGRGLGARALPGGGAAVGGGLP